MWVSDVMMLILIVPYESFCHYIEYLEIDTFNYIRFSTMSFSGSELTLSIFSTSFLNAVGTDLSGQQAMNCSQVVR